MTKKGCITKELQKSQLNRNIHDDGIINCIEILQNAGIQDDSIDPILLLKKDTVTRLIIEDIHYPLLHSGPSHTFRG